MDTPDTGAIIITGEDRIRLFRYVTLKHGLRLEIAGLRMNRGRTAYSIVKAELGFTGSREKVLAALESWIADREREAGIV